MDRVRQVLAAAYAVEQRLGATRNLAVVAALADIRAQLAGLVHAGFVTEAGYARLPDLLRYLTAIERRLDRLAGNPQRDRAAGPDRRGAEGVRRTCWPRCRRRRRQSAAVRQIRWMIEELRVNVFAQALGTPYPVSEQRIYRAMDDAEGR